MPPINAFLRVLFLSFILLFADFVIVFSGFFRDSSYVGAMLYFIMVSIFLYIYSLNQSIQCLLVFIIYVYTIHNDYCLSCMFSQSTMITVCLGLAQSYQFTGDLVSQHLSTCYFEGPKSTSSLEILGSLYLQCSCVAGCSTTELCVPSESLQVVRVQVTISLYQYVWYQCVFTLSLVFQSWSFTMYCKCPVVKLSLVFVAIKFHQTLLQSATSCQYTKVEPLQPV